MNCVHWRQSRDSYGPKRLTNTRDDKIDTKFWKDSDAVLLPHRLSVSPTATSPRTHCVDVIGEAARAEVIDELVEAAGAALTPDEEGRN